MCARRGLSSTSTAAVAATFQRSPKKRNLFLLMELLVLPNFDISGHRWAGYGCRPPLPPSR